MRQVCYWMVETGIAKEAMADAQPEAIQCSDGEATRRNAVTDKGDWLRLYFVVRCTGLMGRRSVARGLLRAVGAMA